MSSLRLTTTSYVVLGLIDACEPATPYDVKQFAEVSTSNFWTVPHTQLYAECAKLAEAGLVDEEREQSGRRRRVYRLTETGALALEEWRQEPDGETPGYRDVGVVKLFLGGDPAALASSQIAHHEAKIAEFEQTARSDLPEGMRHALELGIELERTLAREWQRLAARESRSQSS